MERVDPILMRPTRAAKMLDMSRTRVYEMLNAGTLPGIKVGNTWRIPQAAIEKLARDAMNARDDER